ncbi:MAG: sulfotransferase domain-containing protein [Flavobacteriales bacterium]|nr:sulfotransferase domain-containing protein [Flavobacteriales bacterium]MCB9447568.1 sulfotransferase domain-containing protein [Flavobacteriales bacterium]
MLPNVVVIGAQKAGTTTLYEWLATHPGIYLAPSKEVHFFDRDANYNQGPEWYEQHFSGAAGYRVVGEVTPDYMQYDYVPGRMFKVLGPQVKLVMLLRNPVARAYSQFNFHKMHGVEKRKSFEQALESYKPGGACDRFTHWFDPSYYVERSRYHERITRFLEYFPKEQIFVGIFEEMFGPGAGSDTLQRLLAFLGAEAFIPQQEVHANATVVKTGLDRWMQAFGGKAGLTGLVKKGLSEKNYSRLKARIHGMTRYSPPGLKPEVKTQLMQRYFMDDIRQLEQWLERDLSIWYGKAAR